jgi:hypothetical protein
VNVRLYANTSSLALTERLEGGSFQPPVQAAYSDIHVRFKLAELLGGTAILDKRELVSLSARIGRPDTAPVSGTYQLSIALGGDSVTTDGIAFDAPAATIAAAINAALGTTITALNPCTVTTYEGLQRIVFANKALQPVIACEENALWPASFVDVDEIEWNEGWAYVLQLRQAPVAEVEVYSEEVPSAPAIKRLQGGSEIDGLAINEIQKLEISPSFSGGSFRVVRSGIKSAPVVVPTDIAKLRLALAPLADQGGSFLVTEVNDGIYIEFIGSMAGTEQDLMTVEVFESPGLDYFFTLPTRTDSMRTLMRKADETGTLDVPMNLAMEIYDEVTDTTQEITIIQPLRFARPVSSGEHNVAASLRWTQPLSRTDYQQHSSDSLVIGNRARKFVIGNGSDTSFALPHNLVENTQTVTVNATTNVFTAAGHGYQDLDPITFGTSGAIPAGLTVGTLYFVRDATENTFKVSATPNGTPVDVTTTGTGTHTARLKDGTVDGILVEVWATAGSKQRLSQNQYTAAETSLDLVTLSGFPATPTTGQYKVLVMTYGRPATYQHHSHEIDETPEARDRIEALEARVAALEALAPGVLGALASNTTGKSQKAIPHIALVYPVLGRGTAIAITAGQRLAAIVAESLPRIAPRLFAAVHDATVTALPNVLDGDVRIPTAPVEGNLNNVYENQTADEILLDVGSILPGQFAATDGESWYGVEKYASAESSFYPVHLSRVLYEDMVQTDELPLGSTMELRVPLEIALLKGNTTLHCQIVVETAAIVADTTPGTPGSNLASEAWVTVPHLAQNLILTAAPREYVIGYRVQRSKDNVLTADQLKFGKWTTSTAPAAAAFRIRARLIRVDLINAVAEPAGLIAVTGGTPFDDKNGPDSSPNVGYLTIDS